MKLFSRNLEDHTNKYPDLIKRLPDVLVESDASFLADAEVVAWDVNKKVILPFQQLSTRKRKVG